MVKPSRLDEHYGVDPRGLIKRSRLGRGWSRAFVFACLSIFVIAGYQLRAQWWFLYDEVLGLPPRQLTVSGRVVDDETGRGIKGAHVKVSAQRLAFFRRGLGEFFTAEGSTSALGEFRIRADWAETPQLAVTALGYRDTLLTLTEPTALKVRLSPFVAESLQ